MFRQFGSEVARIRAAGHGSDLIVDSLDPCSCGSIRGGVSVRFADEMGGFVLSLEDLDAVVALVKAHRSAP